MLIDTPTGAAECLATGDLDDHDYDDITSMSNLQLAFGASHDKSKPKAKAKPQPKAGAKGNVSSGATSSTKRGTAQMSLPCATAHGNPRDAAISLASMKSDVSAGAAHVAEPATDVVKKGRISAQDVAHLDDHFLIEVKQSMLQLCDAKGMPNTKEEDLILFAKHRLQAAAELLVKLGSKIGSMKRRKTTNHTDHLNELNDISCMASQFQGFFHELSSATPNAELLEKGLTYATRASYAVTGLVKSKLTKAQVFDALKFNRYEEVADRIFDAGMDIDDSSSHVALMMEQIFQRMLRALPSAQAVI